MNTSYDQFEKYGVKQLGYYVESIETAAELFRSTLGAGPFADFGINECESCSVRGESVDPQIRTALGHYKDVQIEFIEVASDGPDPYHEMGHYGLHHFCVWVDDIEEAISKLKNCGLSLSMRMTSGAGLEIAYLDAREILGQYVELNTPSEKLWNGIKALHENAPCDSPALLPMSVLFQS